MYGDFFEPLHMAHNGPNRQNFKDTSSVRSSRNQAVPNHTILLEFSSDTTDMHLRNVGYFYNGNSAKIPKNSTPIWISAFSFRLGIIHTSQKFITWDSPWSYKTSRMYVFVFCVSNFIMNV